VLTVLYVVIILIILIDSMTTISRQILYRDDILECFYLDPIGV